jgi:leader peptidase (prepilin peptidase)/N-methyltransferase
VAATIGCFLRFGLTAQAVIDSVFAMALVVLTATDLERRLIPNAIVLPATVVVLAAQIAFFPDQSLEWVLACIGAALFFFVPLLVYPAGMGMGDVKLAALLGAGLGKSVVDAILAAVFLGAAYAVLVLIRDGRGGLKRTFAFGPFLAVGGLLVLLVGGR